MKLFILCPECGASYASFMLPARDPRCRCGHGLKNDREKIQFVDREELLQEEAKLLELRNLADRVSFLIVATSLPQVDVEIQRAELRRRCLELFPDKMHVYEMIYESRFQRLWEQFRAA